MGRVWLSIFSEYTHLDPTRPVVTPSRHIQHQVLLREREIHHGRVRSNETVCRRGPRPVRVDPVDEEVLVNVRLHGMNDEYRIFLENLTFSSFSKLMEAAGGPMS